MRSRFGSLSHVHPEPNPPRPAPPSPLTPGPHPRKPVGMIILDAATVEHRCEALTIGDIPTYRCTTSATADRRGRAVCASHARALHVRWFDNDDEGALHLHG
jgi:hypothetical protein